jgi:hypothetical protein
MTAKPHHAARHGRSLRAGIGADRAIRDKSATRKTFSGKANLAGPGRL